MGKRTYDDGKFISSLSDQIKMGKRLSDRQVAYLDTLLTKYSEQIENFEQIRKELGLDEKKEVVANPAIAPILAAFDSVTEWAEPVKRGKRVFDDKEFLESLTSQFKAKGTLSDRQVAALKRTAAKYAAQIPNYAQLQETYELPAPRKPKEKAAEADK